jgi:hypothetical protein
VELLAAQATTKKAPQKAKKVKESKESKGSKE